MCGDTDKPSLFTVINYFHTTCPVNHKIIMKSPCLAVALKEYKRVYEHILEMDKRLDMAKKQLQVCEERERKLQKEMVKGSKTPGMTQDKLQQAVDAKNLAQTECESY